MWDGDDLLSAEDRQADSSSQHELPSNFQEVPLQYKVLFAEGAPSHGYVPLAHLYSALVKTEIPTQIITDILREVSVRESKVSEPDFYSALATAAGAQALGEDAQESEPANERSQRWTNLVLNDSADTSHVIPDHGHLEYGLADVGTLSVSVKCAKEGSMFFRHAVYLVSGTLQGTQVRVVRRFRDFTWLLDSLILIYPFRMLPVLPPKTFVVDAHYLSTEADEQFLKRRCAGLARFLNILVKHPVVARSDIVKAFLTSQSPGEVLRNNFFKLKEETANASASPLFISQFNAPEFEERFRAVRAGTQQCIDALTPLCQFGEALAKRLERVALQTDTLAGWVQRVREGLGVSTPDFKEDFGTIDRGMQAVQESATSWGHMKAELLVEFREGPLGELKLLREMLLAIGQLFTRHARFGGDQIPQLERRVSSIQRRLAEAATKPDTKPATLDRLRAQLSECKDSIRALTARSWAIKSILSQELVLVQNVQYQVPVVLQTFASFALRLSTGDQERAQMLSDAVSSLPRRPSV